MKSFLQIYRYSTYRLSKEKMPDVFQSLTNFELLHTNIIPKVSHINQFNGFLQSLGSQDISIRDFEKKGFKNYNYVLDQFVYRNKSLQMDSKLLIEILLNYSLVYKKYGKLETSKTKKFTLFVLRKIFDDENLIIQQQQIFDLIQIFTTLNYKNTHYVPTLYKVVQKNFATYNANQVKELLESISRLNYKDVSFLELIVDKIFNNIEEYKVQDLCAILYNLQILNMKVNKHFLFKASQTLYQKLKTNPDPKAVYYCFCTITKLEKTYTNQLFNIDELDEFYNYFIQSIQSDIGIFNAHQLGNIAGALYRSTIYDKQLLETIIQRIFDIDLDIFCKDNYVQHYRERINQINSKMKELDKDSNEYRKYYAQIQSLKVEIKNERNKNRLESIGIETIAKITKCMGDFNHKNDQFLNYVHQIFELYEMKGNHHDFDIGHKYICRLIQGLCILQDQQQIKNTVRICLKLLFTYQYQLNQSDIGTLYLAYMYMKQTDEIIFSTKLIDNLKELYTKMTNQSFKKISMLCMDISKTMNDLELSHSFEYNIENFLIDIKLQNQICDKTVLIDVHGYHHFLRNQNQVKGNTILKQKILKGMGYTYIYISAYDWHLLENKDKKKLYSINIRLIVKSVAMSLCTQVLYNFVNFE